MVLAGLKRLDEVLPSEHVENIDRRQMAGTTRCFVGRQTQGETAGGRRFNQADCRIRKRRCRRTLALFLKFALFSGNLLLFWLESPDEGQRQAGC